MGTCVGEPVELTLNFLGQRDVLVIAVVVDVGVVDLGVVLGNLTSGPGGDHNHH